MFRLQDVKAKSLRRFVPRSFCTKMFHMKGEHKLMFHMKFKLLTKNLDSWQLCWSSSHKKFN